MDAFITPIFAEEIMCTCRSSLESRDQFENTPTPRLNCLSRAPESGAARSKLQLGSEAVGIEQQYCDAVGRISDVKNDATKMFETTIDCWGGEVAGPGSVGVCEEASDALFQ